MAVWLGENGVQAACLPHGGAWSSPVTLSNSQIMNKFAIGISPSGYAVAVWIEKNSRNSIFYSAFW